MSGASRSQGVDDYQSGSPKAKYSMTGVWAARVNQTYTNLGYSSGITIVNTGVGGQTSSTALSLVASQITGPIASNGATMAILGLDWFVNDVATSINNATSASNITGIIDAIIAAQGTNFPIVLITDFILGNPNPSERPDDCTTIYAKNAFVAAAVRARGYKNVAIIDAQGAAKEWQTLNNGPLNPNGFGLRRGLLNTHLGPHNSVAGGQFFGDCLTPLLTIGDGQGGLVQKSQLFTDSGLGLFQGPVWFRRFMQTAQRFSPVIDGGRWLQMGGADTALGTFSANDGQAPGGGIKGNAGTRMLFPISMIATPKTDANNRNLWGVEYWSLFGSAAGGSTASLQLTTGAASPDVIRLVYDPTTYGNNNLHLQTKLSAGTHDDVDLGATTVPDGNPHAFGIFFPGSFPGPGITANTLYATFDGAIVGTQATLTNMTNSPVTPAVQDTAGQVCTVYECAIGFRRPFPII